MELGSLISGNGEIALIHSFVTSLAIGLLIGLERERSPAAKAGLRTFALTGLLGTLLALLAEKTGSSWLLIGGLLSVAAIIVSAYMYDRQGEDPGTTTQAALLLCYGLGVIVWYGYATLAVMLAILITVLLHFKPELHNISASMTRRDIQSILQFAVLPFVILPILPDQNYGPYQTLNPYQIWLMVVLISGLSLAGYIALNFFGQRYGAPLLGFFGGLVSSTATTLVYSRHANNNAPLVKLSAAIIVIANLVVLVRLGVVSSIVAPGIAVHMLPVLLSGLAAGSIFTYFWWKKQQRGKATASGNRQPDRNQGRPIVCRALCVGAARFGVAFRDFRPSWAISLRLRLGTDRCRCHFALHAAPLRARQTAPRTNRHYHRYRLFVESHVQICIGYRHRRQESRQELRTGSRHNGRRSDCRALRHVAPALVARYGETLFSIKKNANNPCRTSNGKLILCTLRFLDSLIKIPADRLRDASATATAPSSPRALPAIPREKTAKPCAMAIR